MSPVFLKLTGQIDYTTRSGMKTCNSDFAAISSRLNAVAFFIHRRIQLFDYDAEELPGLDILSGIIVYIYANLAKDVLLRRRIFAEARQSCPLLFIFAEHFTDTPAFGSQVSWTSLFHFWQEARTVATSRWNASATSLTTTRTMS